MIRCSLSVAMAAVCMVLAGCSAAHRVDVPSIRLMEAAGYPVLSSTADASKQLTVQTTVALGAVSSADCSIVGKVFSLRPPTAGTAQWTMTSPSVQGWQVADTASQLRTEWSAFVAQLAERRRAGCFRAGWSAAPLQQTIADAIPVPADEALVLRYGFSGEGVADLQPGMVLQVERSVLGERKGRRELQSLQADYEVIAAGEGVRLKQVRAETLHMKERPDEIFALDKLTQSATHLRLLLQNLTPGTSAQRPPILLMGKEDAALQHASSGVEAQGCNVAKSVAGVQCLTFHEAVSLLVSVKVNRKPVTFALGTTLGVALESQGIDPATATLRRSLTSGRFATVVFPQTRDGVSHIVLQGGDEIAGTKLSK
ncbi:hypothetical protein [Terriglobus sp. TAA 43]|uniref:hypothetical protein n=1 Tax=Terriglobus sp. TAA 43 TaxID=278961 RepID=UPI000648AC01|nr:hypothetical protein [Terriglobus sp. TAA 43]